MDDADTIKTTIAKIAEELLTILEKYDDNRPAIVAALASINCLVSIELGISKGMYTMVNEKIWEEVKDGKMLFDYVKTLKKGNKD